MHLPGRGQLTAWDITGVVSSGSMPRQLRSEVTRGVAWNQEAGPLVHSLITWAFAGILFSNLPELRDERLCRRC